jgi:hypothetical protein
MTNHVVLLIMDDHYLSESSISEIFGDSLSPNTHKYQILGYLWDTREY